MHRQRESSILYIDQTIENSTDIRCFDMIDGLICQSSLCFMLTAAFPLDLPTPELLNCSIRCICVRNAVASEAASHSCHHPLSWLRELWTKGHTKHFNWMGSIDKSLRLMHCSRLCMLESNGLG